MRSLPAEQGTLWLATLPSQRPYQIFGGFPDDEVQRCKGAALRNRPEDGPLAGSRWYGAFSYGFRAVDPETEVPRHVVLNATDSEWPLPKVMPEGFMVDNGVVLVSDAVRDVIEAHDPLAHQMFPVDVSHNDDRPPPVTPYNLLVVHARVDAARNEFDRPSRPGRIADGEEPLLLDRAATPPLHLWRERHFGRNLMMSDQLREALQAQNLLFWQTTPFEAAFVSR